MPNPNAPQCDCRWFELAVRNQAIPVIFDEEMNEYHLVHREGRGHSLFYHCPFCGGRAPATLRGTYWTEVTLEESRRLHALTKHIKTLEDLFATIGQPDEEFEIGSSGTTPSSETAAPETTLGPRRLVYNGLSESAEVHVSIDRYGRLRFSFSGRYIGPKRSEPGVPPNA